MDYDDTLMTEEELEDRERVALEKLEKAKSASHDAMGALAIWTSAIRQVMRSRPSIADALLEARDRSERSG